MIGLRMLNEMLITNCTPTMVHSVRRQCCCRLLRRVAVASIRSGCLDCGMVQAFGGLRKAVKCRGAPFARPRGARYGFGGTARTRWKTIRSSGRRVCCPTRMDRDRAAPGRGAGDRARRGEWPARRAHFYITFRTDHPGVVIPQRLRAQYPQEMTIVLQHQFWDLKFDPRRGADQCRPVVRRRAGRRWSFRWTR